MNEPVRRFVPDPHPSRLRPDVAGYDRIIAAHREAVLAGEPTYVDPRTGYTVITAAAHLERGACCDSGCRHCPFL